MAGIATFGLIAGVNLPANAASPISRLDSAGSAEVGKVQISGVPHGMFGARDFGRRQPSEGVTASLILRYNRQSELDALVAAQSDRHSPLFRHFLTSEQFNNYFAPTVQQQALVISTLQAAGLRVTQTFSNRTTVDVAGTSAAAERFFGTEIHSFAQGRYGARYANVKPVTLPANIAALVRTVSLSNLIIARTGPRPSLRTVSPAARPSQRSVPVFTGFVMPAYNLPNIPPGTVNVVKDPGFESGAFGHGWQHCETAHTYPSAFITKRRAYTGKYSGFAGSIATSEPEEYGFTGVCQLVTIPKNGLLSAHLYQLTSEKNYEVAGQDVLLVDTSGKIVAVLATTTNNYQGWVLKQYNVAAFAGRNLNIYFGVHGDGDRHNYTQQFVDNVSLIDAGATASPTPTAAPTTNPSPTPTAAPTSTPTAAPTTSPVACTGAKDSGPFDNDFGHLATGIADAFDFPVQHGCSGTGRSVAVVIDSPYLRSDLNAYLAAAKVKQTGTIVDVPVDGGGTYSLPESTEEALDTETIAGLAPGSNIKVYNFPELSDADIDDAYTKIVADNIADVVNASIGGCESADPAFAKATNAIDEQGVAKGITFVESSGDSGSDECGTNNKPPGVSFNGEYSVAVGAVDFTQNGTTGLLTSITSAMDGSFLSGGGVSTVTPLPAYQKGIKNVIMSGRNQPDISLPGVDVAVYVETGPTAQDGTSWSSPEIAALLTEAVQLQGGRLGWVNPQLYALFTSTGYTTDYTDVKTGNNGFYKALTGYDQVTGIGAPKGFALASDLAAVQSK